MPTRERNRRRSQPLRESVRPSARAASLRARALSNGRSETIRGGPRDRAARLGPEQLARQRFPHSLETSDVRRLVGKTAVCA